MFKSILKTMFPFISTAATLGGPLGAMAANAVGKAIGVDKLEPGQIETAITEAQIKDQEALAKLKQAEYDFKLQMEQLGFDNIEKMEAIAAADRASARAREIAVRDHTPQILAYAVTIGFFGLLILMMFRQLPAGSENIASIMLGALTTQLSSVYSYFFGSSSGSAAKTRLLAQSKSVDE